MRKPTTCCQWIYVYIFPTCFILQVEAILRYDIGSTFLSFVSHRNKILYENFSLSLPLSLYWQPKQFSLISSIYLSEGSPSIQNRSLIVCFPFTFEKMFKQYFHKKHCRTLKIFLWCIFYVYQTLESHFNCALLIISCVMVFFIKQTCLKNELHVKCISILIQIFFE